VGTVDLALPLLACGRTGTRSSPKPSPEGSVSLSVGRFGTFGCAEAPEAELVGDMLDIVCNERPDVKGTRSMTPEDRIRCIASNVGSDMPTDCNGSDDTNGPPPTSWAPLTSNVMGSQIGDRRHRSLKLAAKEARGGTTVGAPPAVDPRSVLDSARVKDDAHERRSPGAQASKDVRRGDERGRIAARDPSLQLRELLRGKVPRLVIQRGELDLRALG
jgi:hypothetical protein